MKLIPVITEKSTEEAKKGKYTFRVDLHSTKDQIRRKIEEIFNVHVTNINTIRVAGEKKKTIYGKKKTVKPGKKAVVTLKDKETIDLFETKKDK